MVATHHVFELSCGGIPNYLLSDRCYSCVIYLAPSLAFQFFFRYYQDRGSIIHAMGVKYHWDFMEVHFLIGICHFKRIGGCSIVPHWEIILDVGQEEDICRDFFVKPHSTTPFRSLVRRTLWFMVLQCMVAWPSDILMFVRSLMLQNTSTVDWFLSNTQYWFT